MSLEHDTSISLTSVVKGQRCVLHVVVVYLPYDKDWLLLRISVTNRLRERHNFIGIRRGGGCDPVWFPNYSWGFLISEGVSFVA